MEGYFMAKQSTKEVDIPTICLYLNILNFINQPNHMAKSEVVFPSPTLELGANERYFLVDDENVAEVGRSARVCLMRKKDAVDPERTFVVEAISEESRKFLENLGASVRLLDEEYNLLSKNQQPIKLPQTHK